MPPAQVDRAPSDMTGPTLNRKPKIQSFTSYQELILIYANACRETVMKFVHGVYILSVEYRANLFSMLYPFYAVSSEPHLKNKCASLTYETLTRGT